MDHKTCPICGDEMAYDHDCLSYESIKHSLELDFLGISSELLEPYERAASTLKPYDLPKEQKFLSFIGGPKPYIHAGEHNRQEPLRVSESQISAYTPEYNIIDRNILRRSIPLFLQL